jgi:nitrite reductase/ring-hydroxylating ferredoxin subunit
MTTSRIPAADVPEGTVTGSGSYAVGNRGASAASGGGQYFAVSRRCRHLRADLAGGSIDPDGCLVCPWHQAKYDVESGRMVRGPQGIFAKIPGLGASFIAMTKAWPLRRGKVTKDGQDLVIE